MLNNSWLIRLLLFIGGTIALCMLLLPSRQNIQAKKNFTDFSEHIRSKNVEPKKIFKSINEQKLARISSLGDNVKPSDIRDRDFYERGGLIVSTPDIMELSSEAIETIRENFSQMKSQGYYNVTTVTNLNRNVNTTKKLQEFFKKSGASNYHDELQSVNDYLSFSATDINQSLFSELPRLASVTYGSVSFGKWSSIKHIFKDQEIGVIRLNEQQAGPGGVTRHLLPEELNEEINGLPARYTVEVAPNGQALTSLLWVNGDHMYSMFMQQNAGINSEVKEYFFDLASSLPEPESRK